MTAYRRTDGMTYTRLANGYTVCHYDRAQTAHLLRKTRHFLASITTPSDDTVVKGCNEIKKFDGYRILCESRIVEENPPQPTYNNKDLLAQWSHDVYKIHGTQFALTTRHKQLTNASNSIAVLPAHPQTGWWDLVWAKQSGSPLARSTGRGDSSKALTNPRIRDFGGNSTKIKLPCIQREALGSDNLDCAKNPIESTE